MTVTYASSPPDPRSECDLALQSALARLQLPALGTLQARIL